MTSKAKSWNILQTPGSCNIFPVPRISSNTYNSNINITYSSIPSAIKATSIDAINYEDTRSMCSRAQMDKLAE